MRNKQQQNNHRVYQSILPFIADRKPVPNLIRHAYSSTQCREDWSLPMEFVVRKIVAEAHNDLQLSIVHRAQLSIRTFIWLDLFSFCHAHANRQPTNYFRDYFITPVTCSTDLKLNFQFLPQLYNACQK